MGGDSKKNTTQFDVVVLGGLNTDFLVQGESLPKPGDTIQGDSFFCGPGGKGMNQAVAAARLGARVALIGKVGQDRRGHELRETLRREKVLSRTISIDRRTPTGCALVMVDRDGEKQILAYAGANANLSVADVKRARHSLENCQVLLTQFEAPLPAIAAAARMAKHAGARVVLDPAPPVRDLPRGLWQWIDLVRPNAGEAEALTGVRVRDRASARRAGRALLKCGVELAIVSIGHGGDLMVWNDGELFLPWFKVKSVDATGAGDAFAAALAVALAEGRAREDAGRFASATAALATTRIGAQSALPTRRQVERLLAVS